MRILLITAVLLLLAPQQLPETTCAFRAVVVDSDGQKAVGAWVSAYPWDRRFSGPVHGGKSQEDGSVLVEGLVPGKYRFYVSKESAGVPDTSGIIYQRAEDHYPVFQVGPDSVNAAPVVLHLPAPYGAMTLHIHDAGGDILVPTARIRLEEVATSKLD